jgi:deoxycytidylate deaminase
MVELKLNDVDFLRAACCVAVGSHDPSTRNGAVLVNPVIGKVMLSGVNGLHSSLILSPGWEKRLERPLKYAFAEHAERAVIYAAAAAGVSTRGLWLYCPWAACADCARAMLFAGVTRLVRCKALMERTPDRWREGVWLGDQVLREGGVEVVDLAEPLGVYYRLDGEEVRV